MGEAADGGFERLTVVHKLLMKPRLPSGVVQKVKREGITNIGKFESMHVRMKSGHNPIGSTR